VLGSYICPGMRGVDVAGVMAVGGDGEVAAAGRARAKEGSLEVDERAGAHKEEDLVPVVRHLL